MLISKRRSGIAIIVIGIVSVCLAFAWYQHIRGPSPLTLEKMTPWGWSGFLPASFWLGSDHKQARPN